MASEEEVTRPEYRLVANLCEYLNNRVEGWRIPKNLPKKKKGQKTREVRLGSPVSISGQVVRYKKAESGGGGKLQKRVLVIGVTSPTAPKTPSGNVYGCSPIGRG